MDNLSANRGQENFPAGNENIKPKATRSLSRSIEILLIQAKELETIPDKHDYKIISGTDVALNIQSIAQQLGLDKSEINYQLSQEKIVNPDLAVCVQAVHNHYKERNFKITPEELQKINDFYKIVTPSLIEAKRPLYLKKEKYNLPRSLVYVPEGEQKGMYVLLKTKGGMKEAGYGSFNRATFALHLETGKKKIFRTAKRDHVHKSEIEVNAKLQRYPNYYAAGIPLQYKSSWRPRRDREIGDSKERFPREDKAFKIGLIMDFIEGGELASKNLNYKQSIKMGNKIAKAITHLHSLGLSHLDLKPHNIFITNKNIPKLADFGFTEKSGTVKNACGTPEYIAPEIWSGKKYKSDPKYDIWALGGILADLIYPKELKEWWDCKELYDKPEKFEKIKEAQLPKRKDPEHLHYIIDQCLTFDPAKRPTAAQVVEMFKKIKT